MTDRDAPHDLPRRAFLAGALGAVAACTPGSPPAVRPSSSAASSSASADTALPATSTAPSPGAAPGASAPTGPPETPTPPPSSPGPAPTPAGIAALAGVIGGPLVLPADRGYAAAARIFNPRFDGAHPVAIAYCTSTDDVRRCVDAARADGVTPIARAGGHSYAGYSTGAGLVIDLRGLSTVTVDGPHVTAAGGARLFDVHLATAPRGVAIPAGSCPTVGVAGLTLGGGLGIEGREHGLTADRLVAIEVALASGELVTATETERADLFWACRGGGGGNFGIATKFVFSTHATADLTRWQLRWPWARSADVLQGWTQWLGACPRESFSALNLASTVGVVHPSVTVFGVVRGTPEQARTLMAGLTRSVGAPAISTYLRTATHDATVRQLAGCAGLTDKQCLSYDGPGAGVQRQAYAGGSELLRAPFTPAGAAAAVAVIDDRQRRRLQTGALLIDSLGGAIDDPAPGATAYVHRGALASLQYLANWNAGDRAAVVASNLAWFAGAKTTLAPHVSGEAYQNYLDGDRADWQRAYYGANYPRLRAVKRAYDPDGIFSFAQAIGA